MLCKKDMLALRMERQHLSQRAGEESYDELFRDVSPVPTEGWTEPGRPPTMAEHVCFDDDRYNFVRRSRSEILKGRFQGERIGYVAREDWELYCCLFRRPLTRLTHLQERLLELLRQEGPMNIALMKEFTGLLVKEITPALHRLQAACILYENQIDNSGDRGWFIFEDEFPDVNLNRYSRTEALAVVLPRFARRQVFFSAKMAETFYHLPAKDVRAVLSQLVETGSITPVRFEGEEGYLLAEDKLLLERQDFVLKSMPALLLQRNDFLVKSCEYCLKEQFRPTCAKWETLYYILIDGELRGAVSGRFKFGPHLVEDILLDIPEKDKLRRKEEILSAAAVRLPPAESPVRRYCGIPQMTLEIVE